MGEHTYTKELMKWQVTDYTQKETKNGKYQLIVCMRI